MKDTKEEVNSEYKGYQYLVLGLPMGHRCGYVKIPSSHYLHEKSYSENLDKLDWSVLDSQKIGKRGIIPLFCSDGKTVTMDLLFDVHGGITFSGELRDKKGWWIGFDCAHAGDGKDVDLMDEEEKEFYKEHPSIITIGVIRTTQYVERECKNLIDQIIKYFDQED